MWVYFPICYFISRHLYIIWQTFMIIVVENTKPAEQSGRVRTEADMNTSHRVDPCVLVGPLQRVNSMISLFLTTMLPMFSPLGVAEPETIENITWFLVQLANMKTSRELKISSMCLWLQVFSFHTRRVTGAVAGRSDLIHVLLCKLSWRRDPSRSAHIPHLILLF